MRQARQGIRINFSCQNGIGFIFNHPFLTQGNKFTQLFYAYLSV